MASYPRNRPTVDAVTLFALALLAIGASTTTLWADLARLSFGTYGPMREKAAFRSMDAHGIGHRLDEASPTEPLILAESLAKDAFVAQRLTEGLYPHPVHTKDIAGPRFVLISASPRVAQEPGWIPAGSYRSEKLYLTQRSPQQETAAKPGTPVGAPDLPLSWPGLLDAACTAIGLGALVLLALSRWGVAMPAAPVATALLIGATTLAVKCAAQSWMQLAWRGLFPGAGALAVLACAAYVGTRRSELSAWTGKGKSALSCVENYGLAALLAALFVRQANLPVELWDGRSIWLFAARRIHTQGMLTLGDLGNPETLWSHADYPLLHSSWMSFTAGYSEPFNERMASIGIAVLLGAVVCTLWRLARAEFGAWAGACFTGAIVLCIDKLTAGAYADGLLATLLTVEVLAFGSRRVEGATTVAWVAAAAAAFTKNEGAVLAVAVAAVFVGLHPSWRAQSWRERSLPFLVFAPAVLHGLWLSGVGIESVTADVTIARSIGDFFPRLTVAVGAVPRLLRVDGYPHLLGASWIGTVGFLAAIAGIVFKATSYWGQVRVEALRVPLLALSCAVIALCFAFGSIAALTSEIKWLVGTALDRLLLHAAMLSALAAMFALAPAESRLRPVLSASVQEGTQAGVGRKAAKRAQRQSAGGRR